MLKLCPFTQSFLQIFFQLLGLVRLLPGQIQVGAAKVAVSCRLLVDRSAQIQHTDNSSRAQIEVLADNLYQLGIRYLASSEGVHIDRSRARYADGIGQLNLTTVRGVVTMQAMTIPIYRSAIKRIINCEVRIRYRLTSPPRRLLKPS